MADFESLPNLQPCVTIHELGHNLFEIRRELGMHDLIQRNGAAIAGVIILIVVGGGALIIATRVLSDIVEILRKHGRSVLMTAAGIWLAADVVVWWMQLGQQWYGWALIASLIVSTGLVGIQNDL